MWPRIANALIGIWLLAAPAVLGYEGAQATNDRIVGPLAASFAIIAIWDATRSLRWMSAVLGGWLLLAPWLLGGGTAATVNSTLCGLLLVAFALLPGPPTARMGGGWRAVLHPDIDDRDHTAPVGRAERPKT
jgi:hypothetical protein